MYIQCAFNTNGTPQSNIVCSVAIKRRPGEQGFQVTLQADGADASTLLTAEVNASGRANLQLPPAWLQDANLKRVMSEAQASRQTPALLATLFATWACQT